MHPDEEQLLQHSLGQLSGAEARALEAHLRDCEPCRRRQENISAILFAKTLAGPDTSQEATRADAPRGQTSSLTPGIQLGRYVLISRLGVGGMGEVFSAYDPQLDRRVAIKLLRSGSLSAAEGKARLQREAQAMARLQHPNVIAVHDVGTFGERVFIAMEYVEGETLSDWLRNTPPWQEVVGIFLQAGRGLAAAHSAGLVHRDFKPDNVLIGQDGRPRVLDFGLARQATITPAGSAKVGELETLPDQQLKADSGGFDVPLTRDGAVMGTPGYMAPEQLSGLPTDARSDQFSFCVALYEALYGKRPFGGSTLKQHALEIARGEVPPPPPTSPVDDWVFPIVKRGLAADPADRWSDMSDLLSALRPRKRTGRTVTLALMGAAAVALGVTGYAGWKQQRRITLCGGAEKRLEGVWDEPTKAASRAAFQATGLPFAPDTWTSVEHVLGAWSAEWVNAEKATCEAYQVDGTDGEALYQLKSTCLEERLQSLAALSTLLRTADRETVANAIMAARSLDSASACFDARSLGSRRSEPTDAAEAVAEAALREVIVKAQAAFGAGKYAHGIELLTAALTEQRPPAAAAEAYLLLGRLSLRAGNPRAARRYHLQAAEQALKALSPELQAIAFSRLHGAEADDAESRDRPSEAGPVSRDDWDVLADAAAARVEPERRWRVEEEITKNDALVASATGHHQTALTEFRKLLALQDLHRGPQHAEVAMTLNNLGVTLTALGQYDEATESYRRSFALHEAVEGAAHPNTASAEHNLAYVLRRLGRYSEAQTHYEHALGVRRAALGREHPETLRTAESLAVVLMTTGQHDRALELLQEILAVRQRLHGERSKELVPTYDLLAELYRRGRFWKEALTWAQLELDVVRETAGPRSKQAGNALYTLGGVQMRLGRWADAQRALDEALSIRRERFGDDANEVAAVYNALGDLALAQRRPAEALPLYQLALSLRRRLATATAEAKAADLVGQGRCLIGLDRAAEAIAPLEEAVGLLRTVEDRQELADAERELGQAIWLTAPERRAEALALLRSALPHLTPDAQRELDRWAAKHGVRDLGPPDAGP